jgi:hypothetical protein
MDECFGCSPTELRTFIAIRPLYLPPPSPPDFQGFQIYGPYKVFLKQTFSDFYFYFYATLIIQVRTKSFSMTQISFENTYSIKISCVSRKNLSCSQKGSAKSKKRKISLIYDLCVSAESGQFYILRILVFLAK